MCIFAECLLCMLAKWLYPVDRVSLRMSCRFTARCITMKSVYDAANKLIVERFLVTEQHDVNLDENEFLYGAFFTLCLFGIDMTIFSDDDPILLSEHPTRFKFVEEVCDFKFNHVLFDGRTVYVSNWNALVEKSCTLTHINNPQKQFRCVRLLWKKIRWQIFDYKHHGFQINILNFDPKDYYCIHCRFRQFDHCVDNGLFNSDRSLRFDFWEDDISRYVLHDDSDNDDNDNVNFDESFYFPRLEKITKIKKSVLRRKHLANMKQKRSYKH